MRGEAINSFAVMTISVRFTAKFNFCVEVAGGSFLVVVLSSI